MMTEDRGSLSTLGRRDPRSLERSVTLSRLLPLLLLLLLFLFLFLFLLALLLLLTLLLLPVC